MSKPLVKKVRTFKSVAEQKMKRVPSYETIRGHRATFIQASKEEHEARYGEHILQKKVYEQTSAKEGYQHGVSTTRYGRFKQAVEHEKGEKPLGSSFSKHKSVSSKDTKMKAIPEPYKFRWH